MVFQSGGHNLNLDDPVSEILATPKGLNTLVAPLARISAERREAAVDLQLDGHKPGGGTSG